MQYACIQACRGRSDLQLEGCICIGMHTENLRCICGRQALYVADAALQISFSWGWCIPPISSEAEPRQQHWWAVAPLQQLGQQHSVVVICDSAAVVDLACHVLQRLPWNSILQGQTNCLDAMSTIIKWWRHSRIDGQSLTARWAACCVGRFANTPPACGRTVSKLVAVCLLVTCQTTCSFYMVRYKLL